MNTSRPAVRAQTPSATSRRRRTHRVFRLPYYVGPIELPLLHLSSRPGLRRLDPRFFGSGKANPRDLRGLPKVFTFVDGSSLGGDAALFAHACAYRGQVDGRRIYNLSAGRADALGYFTTINREAADAGLRRRGYAGVRVDCADGRQVVLLFQPLPVTEVALSKNL